MKKGRPQKKHKPIDASFDEVLGVIARSDKDTRKERKLKVKNK